MRTIPISKKEFEKGEKLTDIEKAIIKFLNDNSDKAYTISEIQSALGYQTTEKDSLVTSILNTYLFVSVLNQLSKKNKIRSKMISGETYYMIEKEIGPTLIGGLGDVEL